MKTKHTIYINALSEISKMAQLEEILNENCNIIEKAEPVHPHSVIVEVVGANMQVNLFVNELKKYGFEFRHTKKRTYTKLEIQKTEFAWMTVPAPWSHNSKTSEKFGTKYTEASCNLCGNSKKQVSELYLPTKKASQYNICCIDSNIIVDKSVQDLLLELDFTGYLLGPIRDSRSKKQSDLKQLIATNILPPMSVETGVIMSRCPQCKRFVLDYVFDEIVYNKVDLDGATDFCLTQEEFSMMNGNAASNGLLIVNHQVIETFIKNKIKGIRFEPIVIK